jgi:hypothetical protein
MSKSGQQLRSEAEAAAYKDTIWEKAFPRKHIHN